MGFGLPSAVGAKVAAPNKTVIDIDGDASFSMTAMELATASQFNIGVKVLVLNNEFQGMVVQWQGLCLFYSATLVFDCILADLFYDHRYSHTRMTNPDFVLLARAMGVHGIRANSASELPEKMKEFLEYDGNKPVLLECVVEPSEHVFPMVGVFSHQRLHYPLISIWCLLRFLLARRCMNRYCILLSGAKVLVDTVSMRLVYCRSVTIIFFFSHPMVGRDRGAGIVFLLGRGKQKKASIISGVVSN